MASMHRLLTKAIHKHFSPFYGNFPTGRPIELGDVGVLVDRKIIRENNIRNIDGISDIKERSDSQGDHYEFSTSGSVSLKFTTKGQVDTSGVAALKAKVDVSFSKEDSVFINAAGCKTVSIEDQHRLGREVLALWEADKWNRKHVIVTTLVQAGLQTLVVAGSSGSSIEIEASADTIEDLDLADASVGLAVRNSDKLAFKSVGKGEHFPLIGLAGVRKRFWSRRRVFGQESLALDMAEGPVPPVFSNSVTDKVHAADEFYFGSLG